jgi:hypothetical protein
MWQWITIASVLAGLAVAAFTISGHLWVLWRHIFPLDLPVNLTAHDTLLGESHQDGRRLSKSVSYRYRLTNSGHRDIQIANIILQRRRWFGLCWCVARDSGITIEAEPLPQRLQPNAHMYILVTIEQAGAGKHRLNVDEYASFRSAKLTLSELEHVPTMAQS